MSQMHCMHGDMRNLNIVSSPRGQISAIFKFAMKRQKGGITDGPSRILTDATSEDLHDAKVPKMRLCLAIRAWALQEASPIEIKEQTDFLRGISPSPSPLNTTATKILSRHISMMRMHFHHTRRTSISRSDERRTNQRVGDVP
jgi:hypothetical protein